MRSQWFGCAIAAAAGLATSAAPGLADQPFTRDQADKVVDMYALMLFMQRAEDAERAAMDPPMGKETLEGCLNQGGGNETEYTRPDGRIVTIDEAILHYGRMITDEPPRLCLDNSPGSSLGSTTPADGLGADVVRISKRLMDRLCQTDANGGTTESRGDAKLDLLATLANELAHVYQDYPDGLNASDRRKVRCDRERDSDVLTIKFLCRYIELLEKDGGTNGDMAEDSLDDIADNNGLPGRWLRFCLGQIGVDTAAELETHLMQAKSDKAAYERRKTETFADSITNNIRWDYRYYSRLRRPEQAKVTRVGRTISYDGNEVGTVPNDGKNIVGRDVSFTETDPPCRVLRVFTADANGGRCVHTWVDKTSDATANDPDGDTKDGTPGLYLGATVLATATRPAPPRQPADGDAAPAGERNEEIYFSSTVIHDMYYGEIVYIETNPDGSTTGQSQVVVADGDITLDTGTFFWLDEISNPAPGITRFSFSSEDDQGGEFVQAAAAENATDLPGAPPVGLGLFGQLWDLLPTLPPLGIDADSLPVQSQTFGAPTELLVPVVTSELPPQQLGFGPADPLGILFGNPYLVPPFGAVVQIEGDGFGNPRGGRFFLPPQPVPGATSDHDLDVNLDGVPDVIGLWQPGDLGPERSILSIFSSLPPLPGLPPEYDGGTRYLLQGAPPLLLPRGPQPPTQLPVQAILGGIDGPEPLPFVLDELSGQPLPQHNPGIDLNGDTIPGDGLAVCQGPLDPQPLLVPFFLPDPQGAPFVLPLPPLPLPFPSIEETPPFTVVDSNNDSFLDVVFQVTPPVVAVNDGAGEFSLVTGCNGADIAPPFGVLDLSDVQTFLIGFGSMDHVADLVPDGIFDLQDVQTFLIAFGAGCP